jgi:hypothetical protein
MCDMRSIFHSRKISGNMVILGVLLRY